MLNVVESARNFRGNSLTSDTVAKQTNSVTYQSLEDLKLKNMKKLATEGRFLSKSDRIEATKDLFA